MLQNSIRRMVVSKSSKSKSFIAAGKEKECVTEWVSTLTDSGRNFLCSADTSSVDFCARLWGHIYLLSRKVKSTNNYMSLQLEIQKRIVRVI